MAEFVCKVGDASGRVFSQVETAQSEDEARQKLADRGFYVFSVRHHFNLLAQFTQSRQERAIRPNDFLIFNQQFNTLIRAGLPILKALDLLAERAAAPRLRPVLIEVRDRVRDGALLSEALAAQGSFPPVYVTAITAGERSGNLTGVLDQYIAYLRVSTTLRTRLLSAQYVQARAKLKQTIQELRNAKQEEISGPELAARIQEIYGLVKAPPLPPAGAPQER